MIESEYWNESTFVSTPVFTVDADYWERGTSYTNVALLTVSRVLNYVRVVSLPYYL